MKKQKRIRLVRRVVQIIFLFAFLYLLANTSYPMKTPISTMIFLKLSPLISIITIIAGRAFFSLFWISLIILALSLIFRRYFCGWICPFGTTFDITDRILGKIRKKRLTPRRRIHHIKYFILITLIVTAAFGLNLSGWFDPISWSTRIYGLVIHPSAYFVSDYTADRIGWQPLTWIQRMIFHPQSDVGSFNQPHFQHTLPIIILFIALVSFGLVMRRFYCRILCPLGALFALVGRFSFFRRYTSDACIECGDCFRECKMGTITENGKGTTNGECILCFNCDTLCPVDSIYWDPLRKKREGIAVTSKPVHLDFTRRELIASILAGLALLPIVKLVLAGTRTRRDADTDVGTTTSRIIRPPGAPDEGEFLAACVKCGQCMKVCETNGLQPLLLENGLEPLWTPTLVPRIGHCSYTCTLCMQVCPTGALEQLPLDQKQYFVLGKAEIDTGKCIPWMDYSRWTKHKDEEWSRKYHCSVCEEHCPGRDDEGNKAILLKWSDIPEDSDPGSAPLPYVNSKACIGCGQCEKVCPVEGDSAIRVYTSDERGIPAWARDMLKPKQLLP